MMASTGINAGPTPIWLSVDSSHAMSSSMAPKTTVKQAFQGPVNPSSNMLAVGWVEQWRRSKLSKTWKHVLLSLVKGQRPGEETTLWIQREVAKENGSKELESLQSIPIKWIQSVDHVQDCSAAGDNRFYLRIYNIEEEVLFRCSGNPDATRSWVTTLRTVQNFVQGKHDSNNQRKEMTRTHGKSASEGLTENLISFPDLKADFPDLKMDGSAKPSVNGVQRPQNQQHNHAATMQSMHQSHLQSHTPQPPTVPWQHQAHRPLQQVPGNFHQPVAHHPHSNVNQQPVTRQPFFQGQVHPFPQQQSQQWQNQRAPPSQTPQQTSTPHSHSKWQPGMHSHHHHHHQQQNASHRPNSYPFHRTNPPVTIPQSAYRHTTTTTPSQHPAQPTMQPKSTPVTNFSTTSNQQHGSKPNPGVSAPPRSSVAYGDKYSKEAGIIPAATAQARIRHQVLLEWALQPPVFQQLRPIHMLITTIQNVFPPRLTLLPRHEYFTKWTAIAPQEVMGNGPVVDDEKLQKAIRKLRFFLHPDKLPRDLNSDQSYLCKLLWDITNDAWEEYKTKKQES